MLKLKCFISFALLFTFVSVGAFANSIGLSYTSGYGDMNFGVTGDYEEGALEVEGTAHVSDSIDAKIEPAIKANVFGVNGRIFSVNTFKGDTYNNLGRVNDLGLDLIFPIEGVDVSVGIFGRNGNPFAPTSAAQTLVDKGFDEDEVGMVDLSSLSAADRGLTIKEGSSVNAAIGAEFDVNRFEIEVRGLLEVMGEGPRADQLIVDISTDGQLSQSLGWNVALEVEAQKYDGNIEYENAIFAGLSYDF